MGIPDSSLLDLIEKVRSWVSWGGVDLSDNFDMLNRGCKMCCECNREFNINEMTQCKYNCKSCGRWLCGMCIKGSDDVPNLESNKSDFRETIHSCKFCSDAKSKRTCEGHRKCIEKVHPANSPQESPRESPEPPSPCFSVENGELNQGSQFDRHFHDQDCGYYPHSMINRSMNSPVSHLSPVSTHPTTSR